MGMLTQLTNFSASERTMPSNEMDRKDQGDINRPNSAERYETVAANNASTNLLLEILNDETVRNIVIERHQEAFKNYMVEISHH